MESSLWGVGIFLLVNAFLCLYRAFRGPTVADRILGVNIIGTKTLVMLVLLAFVFRSRFYLDVAVVYGLLNFVVTLAAARFLETGRLKEEWKRC